MSDPNLVTRRDFVKASGSVAASSLLTMDASPAQTGSGRRRYAIVGTGDRATGMWGRPLVSRYSDVLEFVGLCDINSKRVAAAKEMIGVECPTFTDFDEMCDKTKPDLLMVTTVDAFHSQYITRGLDRGIDVITEKPMVIDEAQCQLLPAVAPAEIARRQSLGS